MLKDIVKILIGFFLADMVALIWLIASGILPIDFIGLKWGFASIMIATLTDFVILILLVYYAWIRKPKQKKEEENQPEKIEE